MQHFIEQIKKRIEPLQRQIINHRAYSVIDEIEDLQVFMQYHVFAVWDFMSLLKALQNNLTCTTIPWFPRGAADTRYFINEIVVGEESDVDHEGNRTSHFELYLAAMKQCGADTSQIEGFIRALQRGESLEVAFAASNTPQAARDFVAYTFGTIHSGKAYLQAATFTFGREDLIPGMFLAIVNDMHKTFPDSVGIFKYYLERHIEVDGDHHSRLALQMTESLCEDNPAYWAEAEAAIVDCLQKRLELWDGIYQEITARKEQPAAV